MVSKTYSISSSWTITTIALIWSLGNSSSNKVLAVDSSQKTTPQPKCEITYRDNRVYVDDTEWLALGRTCVREGGREYCTSPASSSSDLEHPKSKKQHFLRKQNDAKSLHSTDPLGDYMEYGNTIEVGSNSNKKVMECNHREYIDDATTLLFSQNFINSFHHTDYPASNVLWSANKGMASWYPSFQIPKRNEEKEDGVPKIKRGFLSIHGRFLGGDGNNGSSTVSDWSVEGLNEFHNPSSSSDGLTSGPVALFSDECVVIMSSASSFMSSSSLMRSVEDDGGDDGGGSEWGYGVMGSITNIPEGYNTSTILSSFPMVKPDGIRQAFVSWGAKLRKLYGTKRVYDKTLNELQWSTDRGSFYYYNKEANKTYQQTIIDAQQYTAKVGLPFHSWLMDSWFYYKGIGIGGGGVKNWTAMPSIFPNGIGYVTNATGWKLVAHNRFWSSDTDYAIQNGGNYKFAVEPTKSLPLEYRFWKDLFAASKLWGLTVYEQDWMDEQTKMNLTLQDVHAARTWLLQMGKAAEDADLTVQYCMTFPRHALQSLEINAVTQARASNDYIPGNDSWMSLGITSMFAQAMDLAPLKDNFWSSATPQYHPQYGLTHEPAARLQSIVATYSTTVVAPGDDFRSMDVALIMKSCTKDGYLLRPDVPAVRTDRTFMAEAGFYIPHIDASSQHKQVWTTYSNLGGYVYTYILAADSPPFVITEQDLYPSDVPLTTMGGSHILWNLNHNQEDSNTILPHMLPLHVPSTNKTHFHAYCAAPIFPNGWVFLGEAETKWTAVSARDRFSNLRVGKNHFSVMVKGAPNEMVYIVVRKPGFLGDFERVECTLSEKGLAEFYSSDLACHDGDDKIAAIS